jgi:hypothetical protein
MERSEEMNVLMRSDCEIVIGTECNEGKKVLMRRDWDNVLNAVRSLDEKLVIDRD